MSLLPAALLFLAAASPAPEARVDLVWDDLVTVGASKTRTLDIPVDSAPAVVRCAYRVHKGASGVRLALLDQQQAARLAAGQPHRTLAESPFMRRGNLRRAVSAPGTYQLLLDNRLEGRGSTEVHLSVRVTYSPRDTQDFYAVPPRVRTLLYSAGSGFFLVSCLLFWYYLRRARRTRLPPPPSA
jgi:hypothetical protein